MTEKGAKTGTIKSKLSTRLARVPYSQLYDTELDELLNARNRLKIENESLADVTPQMLKIDYITAKKFKELHKNVKANFINDGITSSRGSVQSQSTASHTSVQKAKLGGLKLSLEDVIYNVGSFRNVFNPVNEVEFFDDLESIEFTEHKHRFIKVTLRTSECLLLYESPSLTESKNTPNGDFVEEDNKIYDYLTFGRGMVRRRSEAETQTIAVTKKTRFVNTCYREFEEKAAFVSFFDVYDVYKALSKQKTQGIAVEEQRSSTISDPHMYIREQLYQIYHIPNFRFSSMVIERLLASNVYKDNQQRFRNFSLPSKTQTVAEYRYHPNILFILRARFFQANRKAARQRRAVSDISFCYGNGDILAVAYGLFSYSALITATEGNVCVWSIKNPQNPERSYNYNIPVTAVEFSPFLPSLIAVGMVDGSVEVRNITQPDGPPIAITQRSTSPNREPVVAIRWFKEPQDNSEADPLLALSLNGEVWKYCLIRSNILLGFKQIILKHVEGKPEGLLVEPPSNPNKWFANRHPLGLNITLHPLHNDIYYLLTDEGCVYKCSTNHSHSYLENWRTHEGAVNCMDFSPWSPKLFLTCGNDWCIRIWMDGISKPLITLKHKMNPINAAQWSRTHSTIIISVDRSAVDIWDIHRNILTPISRTKFDTAFNTMFKFNLDGYSIAIGNERGDVTVCALEKMPFAPHFQYEELRTALFGAVSASPDLTIQLNNIGFFGYSRKAAIRTT